MTSPVDLQTVLADFEETWAPRTIAVLNDYGVRVFKAQGAFMRHSHPETDEVFLLLSGP